MVTFLISQWSTSDLTGFLESMNKKERARMWEALSQSGLFGSKLGHYFKAKLGHPQLCHNLHLLFACSPQIHPRCKPGVFSGIFLEHASSAGHSHRTLPSFPSPCSHMSLHPLPSLPWCWVCLPLYPSTIPCPEGQGLSVSLILPTAITPSRCMGMNRHKDWPLH